MILLKALQSSQRLYTSEYNILLSTDTKQVQGSALSYAQPDPGGTAQQLLSSFTWEGICSFTVRLATHLHCRTLPTNFWVTVKMVQIWEFSVIPLFH